MYNMGRISKRKAASSCETGALSTKKRYKAGIYARLSSDQNIRKNESMEVQVQIGKKFVEEFNQKGQEIMDIVDCYCDLGKTGSNFNRDAFKRLMQDIRLGNIDCVIVKDLSRFGRNYLEAGSYIEKIFPFLGVRFIAVSDGYDTGEKGNDTNQIASEIKNLANDMYAKDFSAKAKAGLKSRRERGSYVGGPPPYGYTAVYENKIRKLVPDENTAKIVRYIFKQFIEQHSYAKVVDELNRRRINPPAVFKKKQEVYCPADEEYKGWNNKAVERIIKSKTYIGTLEQGKTSITARDESNRIHIDEKEWIVKENIHEALINTETYKAVQKVRQEINAVSAMKKHLAKDCPIEENIFENVLYCGICGRKMTRNSHVKNDAGGNKARLDGYFCSSSIEKWIETCPKANRISKIELTDILMPVFHIEFCVYLDKPTRFLEAGKDKMHQIMLENESNIRNVKSAIQKKQEEEEQLYMQYCEGALKQEEYAAYRLKRDNLLKELQNRHTELLHRQKELKRAEEKYLRAIKSLLKRKSGKELSAEVINDLIERIYVYPNKRVEIQFRYANERLEGVV